MDDKGRIKDKDLPVEKGQEEAFDNFLNGGVRNICFEDKGSQVYETPSSNVLTVSVQGSVGVLKTFPEPGVGVPVFIILNKENVRNAKETIEPIKDQAINEPVPDGGDTTVNEEKIQVFNSETGNLDALHRGEVLALETSLLY